MIWLEPCGVASSASAFAAAAGVAASVNRLRSSARARAVRARNIRWNSVRQPRTGTGSCVKAVMVVAYGSRLFLPERLVDLARGVVGRHADVLEHAPVERRERAPAIGAIAPQHQGRESAH